MTTSTANRAPTRTVAASRTANRRPQSAANTRTTFPAGNIPNLDVLTATTNLYFADLTRILANIQTQFGQYNQLIAMARGTGVGTGVQAIGTNISPHVAGNAGGGSQQRRRPWTAQQRRAASQQAKQRAAAQQPTMTKKQQQAAMAAGGGQ